MKKLVAVVLLGSFAAMGAANAAGYVQTQEEAKRLCEIFKKKTEDYRKSMRNDELAHKTLESYIARENKFCSKVKNHS